MPKHTSAIPRKQPRQARAQATVNAILEATIQVFDREGEDAATTTRIAEIAGVSVGTLYQYFSHRDAILNALQDREFERALLLLQNVLSDGNLEKTPRETVTAVVRGLAALYASCPGLHRVLAIEGLRVAKADRVHAFDMRVVAIVRHFLAATRAPIRRKNVDAAAFVVFQSVRATMLANLLERPPGLDEATLVDEVSDLALRYLVSTPRARATQSLNRRRPSGSTRPAASNRTLR
jgi:AcrR family transcriptional regulator